MKDTDRILEHPAIGERAFAQVKSKADQAVLDDDVGWIQKSTGVDRLFFICHSPQGQPHVLGSNLHVWTGDTLADAAVKAGLFDWLMERTG